MRRAVAEADPQLAIFEILSMEQRIDERLEDRRFAVYVLGALAGLALLLALVGVYGVIAFSIAQRTRELGIRSALGARPRALLLLVVGQSMRPVVAGVLVGLAGAFAATRLLAGMLFGVGPTDPVTFVAVPLVLAGCAALAALLASRRATRVDPMVALRAD
jgi:putative ABC transport system permease protein